MRAKNVLIGLLVSAGALLAPVASHADSRVSVGITVGPPTPPVVMQPVAPAPGYVWAPGYYGWNGYQYIWVSGRWIAPRPGYVWVADRWEQRGPHWQHMHGYWARDRHGHGRGHGHHH